MKIVDLGRKNEIFCKKWHIHFLAPSRHDYFDKFIRFE